MAIRETVRCVWMRLAERACGDCITDLEIALMLSPVVEYVLSYFIDESAKEPESERRNEWIKSLEMARTMFIVRNIPQNNRPAAIKALGLEMSKT